MPVTFGPRRGEYIDISKDLAAGKGLLTAEEIKLYEDFDLIFRSLCASLYNFVPMSGHPGGSISSGRFAQSLVFETMGYDFSNPDRIDADIISYTAGHKALGLYALWALRNEIVRIVDSSLLPSDVKWQLRLEDLLGFRRNPITATPLFNKFKAKALDGHPTPITPFIRLSTGASGVGFTASLGLALAASDYFGKNRPWVHMIEGEGGFTPGRVSEGLAAAGTTSLKNAVLHLDWNQASIDSNRVCREGNQPGDYVQWDPMELAYLHDWNVIFVPDGTDFQQIIAAQRMVATLSNGQPSAIVYRTKKGWRYGIEGKGSHGAGHTLCSEGFAAALKPLLDETGATYPSCPGGNMRCNNGKKDDVLEECFWSALSTIRKILEKKPELTGFIAKKVAAAKKRLDAQKRSPRANAPSTEAIFAIAQKGIDTIPQELVLSPGKSTTLRGELGRVLNYFNKASKGSILAVSADLLGSTSVTSAGEGFGAGYYNAETNQASRLLSLGGICEDAQAGIIAGISTFGRHIGVSSSYAAFISVLGHIATRLHAIGCEAKKHVTGEPYKPIILICAHAGIKTGEDGPTHADPQPLQLLQENFPRGTVVTLTPWDPQEMWVVMAAALAQRPAAIFPFVTRPNETVVDRAVLGLAPATAAAKGMYLLHRSRTKSKGCVVLQGSEVGIEFATVTLPLLLQNGIDLDAYYIASAELFDQLPPAERKNIFSQEAAQCAMGISGFTLPTLYRWVATERGREHSLYPFKKGRFLGSGRAEIVQSEAGLDGKSQFEAIARYLKTL